MLLTKVVLRISIPENAKGGLELCLSPTVELFCQIFRNKTLNAFELVDMSVLQRNSIKLDRNLSVTLVLENLSCLRLL